MPARPRHLSRPASAGAPLYGCIVDLESLRARQDGALPLASSDDQVHRPNAGRLESDDAAQGIACTGAADGHRDLRLVVQIVPRLAVQHVGVHREDIHVESGARHSSRGKSDAAEKSVRDRAGIEPTGDEAQE